MLVNFIAIYWLLGGLLTIRLAIGVHRKAGSRLALAAGLLAIGTSLVLLSRNALDDLVSVPVLVNLVAATTVGMGCLRLVGAFEVEERTGHRWMVGGLMLGTVEVAIGALLFLAQNASATTIRVAMGAWASPRASSCSSRRLGCAGRERRRWPSSMEGETAMECVTSETGPATATHGSDRAVRESSVRDDAARIDMAEGRMRRTADRTGGDGVG